MIHRFCFICADGFVAGFALIGIVTAGGTGRRYGFHKDGIIVVQRLGLVLPDGFVAGFALICVVTAGGTQVGGTDSTRTE